MEITDEITSFCGWICRVRNAGAGPNDRACTVDTDIACNDVAKCGVTGTGTRSRTCARQCCSSGGRSGRSEDLIASEFPAYDKDASGALSKVEFDTWLVALKEKSGDATMKTADQTSWLKKAFATADKDKTKDVSLAELTDYLTAAS